MTADGRQKTHMTADGTRIFAACSPHKGGPADIYIYIYRALGRAMDCSCFHARRFVSSTFLSPGGVLQRRSATMRIGSVRISTKG